jgi:protein-disulfide isomerase
MLKTAFCAALAVTALASCTKDGPGIAPDLKALPPTTGEAAKPAASAPGAHDLKPVGSVEERLARIEKRVNKITQILEGAMPPPEADPSKTYAVSIDPTDPIEGPTDAKVTIVEGFEFLCPYCWKANPTIEQVLAAYPKDVRVVNKYFLIHGRPAIAPGMAACAANKQGKFGEMKKLLWSRLFSQTGQVQQDQIAPENMEKLAAELKLDAAKFKTDMEAPDCQAWMQRSQESLQPVGTTGTPSFYVNGRHLVGAVSFEELKPMIDDAIAKATKAIDGGVPKAEYYQREIVGKGDKRVAGYFED